MTQANSPEVCRLCGSENGIHIHMFDSTPENECVAKIEAVIPDLVILRNDSLSKLVCHRCVAKIKDFYEFKETCIQTQLVLKSRIPWMSSGIPAFRVVSPVVKYIGGPLAFPYGQPEPEVEVLTLSDDEDNAEATRLPNCTFTSANSNSAPTRRKACESNHSLPASTDGHPVVHSFQNGNGMPTRAVNNSVLQSVGFCRTNASAPDPFPSAIQSTRTSPVPPSTSCKVLLASNVAGPALSGPPSHPFRSFAQFHQSLAAANMKKSIHQQSSCTPPETLSAPPPSVKRAWLQALEKRADSNESNDIQPPRKRHVSDRPRVAALAGLPNVSDNSMVFGLPPVPHPTPLRSPALLPQSNISVHIPGTNHIVSAGQSKPPTSIISQISDNAVCDSTVKVRKTQKPKPKSKRKPIVLSEADTDRICKTYPEIKALKICENTTIFTCMLCNKILMNEEAVGNHECVTVPTNEVLSVNTSQHCNGQSNTSDDQLLNLNENSNHSTSSCVELSSDDEMSSCNLAAKHICNVCGKEFHNLARLQKHEVSHNTINTTRS